MALQLQVHSNAAACASKAAELLLTACQRHPHRPLGLATGRTMEPVYQAFVAQVRDLPAAEQQQLRHHWCSFNLDEYVGLAADDPRSFRAFMAHHLVDPLALDPARVHLPRALPLTRATPQAAWAEAQRYGQALAAAGGVGLQLLGLGGNGHVGFNEPPTPATARCRPVQLSASTRRQNAAAFGGEPAAVPSGAISLGLAEILAAEQICLVVTGASKGPILRRLLQEPPSAQLPASWLQEHPRALLLADQEAMAG